MQALNPLVKTYFIPLELSSPESVHKAATEILSNTDIQNIDVLINSAGVMGAPYTPIDKWKDSKGSPLDLHFAVNHLGHLLLTLLLLERIWSSGPGARIIDVGAAAHRVYGVNLYDLTFSVCIFRAFFLATATSSLANQDRVCIDRQDVRCLEGIRPVKDSKPSDHEVFCFQST